MRNQQGKKFNRVHIEEIQQNIDKAIAITVLLESELGCLDQSYANTATVIKELLISAEERIEAMEEQQESVAVKKPEHVKKFRGIKKRFRRHFP